MSIYDTLDARTELEQVIYSDLKRAFEKRGFNIVHNGGSLHAAGGRPDIELFDNECHLTFEPTKSRGASQDREFNSIRDHLIMIKNAHPQKKCYCVFVSGETSKRMIDSIRDHNRQRQSDGIQDLKIIPICFDTLEIYLDRLATSDRALYPFSDLLTIFNRYNEFLDDLRIKKLIQQIVFSNDDELRDQVESEEKNRDNVTLQNLIKDLTKLENYMRENGIATASAAINTLIYIVFIKLYEEKRASDGDENRFNNVETYSKYARNLSLAIRNEKKVIHQLFNSIKCEGEFIESEMFASTDDFPDTLNDDFIIDKVLPVLSYYTFYGTKVDALGAVYEVLALRSEKDVKVGQFFTPENVVRFMVKIAELEQNDYVLDPACGTGRFLIHAMDAMIRSVNQPTQSKTNEKLSSITKQQIHGADIDRRIAKIAKMNMWIHGDGKTNIKGEVNGLTLNRIGGFNRHETYDNSFDVVLTNPPLGELNYQTATFTDLGDAKARIIRLPVIPNKDKNVEKFMEIKKRLEGHIEELEALKLRRADEIEVETQKALDKVITRKQQTVTNNEQTLQNMRVLIGQGQKEIEITGNTLKGGALFLAAIRHYLKNDTEKSDLPEWRGGKLITILDEGILNTDNYKDVRSFIRSHFYIKAIVSLSRDAFIPVSNTSTKTSIVYLIKKTDITANQKEPIFFAHAEKVGMDRVGKVCENHLDYIIEQYMIFKTAVLESYNELEFIKDTFTEKINGGKASD